MLFIVNKEVFGLNSKNNHGIGKSILKTSRHASVVTTYLILYDIAAVNVSYFATLWLRFDLRFSQIPAFYLTPFRCFAPVYTLFCILLFNYLHLYSSIWRFASYTELGKTIVASVISAVFHGVGISLAFHRMPVSYYLFGALIQFMLVLGIRFSYRFVLLEREARFSKGSKQERIMLIGAGNAGQMILRDITIARETDARV